MRDRVPLAAMPVDRAPLRVLESANMPAALIEAGYLTNPEQERFIAGDAFQAALVQSIYDAVVRFRDLLTPLSQPGAPPPGVGAVKRVAPPS
jgi:N-acetylmuramoyl-L-alanine amidase